MSEKKPTKRVLAALEKVFAAEIDGKLPFQSKAAICLELEASGLLEKVERRFGTGPLAVTVRGYALTHAGRILYCANTGSDGVE